MDYFKDCTTIEEAKTLYRKLAFELHPDYNNGNRVPFQEMANQFEAFSPTAEKERFTGQYKQWEETTNAKDFMNIINELLKIKDIEVWVAGDWVWVQCPYENKEGREQMKAIEDSDTYGKARFSKGKEKWYFSPLNYKRKHKKTFSFEEILNNHQGQKVNPQKEEDKPKRPQPNLFAA